MLQPPDTLYLWFSRPPAEKEKQRAHPHPCRERLCREPAARPDGLEPGDQAQRWLLARPPPAVARPRCDGPVVPEPGAASKDIRGQDDSCFQDRPEARIVRRPKKSEPGSWRQIASGRRRQWP